MMITVDGLTIELSRKRVKNLNLRINARGEVKVSAPLRFPVDVIHRYLQDKREWIEAQRARMQAQSLRPTLQFETGERHLYLGKEYELQVYGDAKQHRITLEGDNLHCFVMDEASILRKQALLQTWYRKQMKDLLPDIVKKWEAHIKVQVNACGIRAMRTRWGSCNPTKKRIWLNLSLIQKPLICLEYVLVHEMVHLLEASHNHRFYALMTEFMPDWPSYQKLLVCKS